MKDWLKDLHKDKQWTRELQEKNKEMR